MLISEKIIFSIIIRIRVEYIDFVNWRRYRDSFSHTHPHIHTYSSEHVLNITTMSAVRPLSWKYFRGEQTIACHALVAREEFCGYFVAMNRIDDVRVIYLTYTVDIGRSIDRFIILYVTSPDIIEVSQLRVFDR